MSNQLTKSGKRINKVNIILLLSVISLVSLSGYLYKELKDQKNSAPLSSEDAQKEAVVLKNKVSKMISLPDEIPVIGTVNDKNKFKDQPFFNDVENGDRLLIFSESKKVVIYREKDNKLINVGPIAVTSEAENTAKKVSVLVSGSENSKDSTNEALAKINGIKVTKGSAKTKVDKSKVYDVDNNDSELAKQIASAIGAEVVSSVPAGENNPEGVDLVIYESQ